MNLSDRIINPLTTKSAVFHQSENASLDYTIDYTAYLGTATIASSTWSTRESGLTITPADTTKKAIAKLSGTFGIYQVVNKITTTAGVTDERIIKLYIDQNDRQLIRDYWPQDEN